MTLGLLFRKAAEQLGLFSAPVQVRGHARHTEHGTEYVRPHLATRQKRTSQASRPVYTIRDDVLDAHHGQIDGELAARDQVSGKVIGVLSYALFEGAYHIQHIEVVPEHRRQGIGMDLIHRLRDEGKPIVWGMTSEEGSKLKAAVEAAQADSDAREYRERGVRSKAFKAWFGDWEADPAQASKVVEVSGEPQETYHLPVVVYHGTSTGRFAEFAVEKQNPDSLYGPGFYFTESRAVAEEYQRKSPVPPYPLRDGQLQTLARFIRKHLPAGFRLERKTFAIFGLQSRRQIEYFLNGPDDHAAPKHVLSIEMAGHMQDVSFIPTVLMWDAATTEAWKTLAFANGWVPIDKHPEVKALYLNIRRPFYPEEPLSDDDLSRLMTAVAQYETRPWPSGQMPLAWLRSKSATDNLTGADVLNRIGPNVIWKQTEQGYVPLLTRYWREFLKGAGYDGISHVGGTIIGNRLAGLLGSKAAEQPHRVWIAFDPTQIKAVDNIGTFDQHTPDILKTHSGKFTHGLHGGGWCTGDEGMAKGIQGGNHPIDYKTEFQGLPITIENRKGSIRRWKDSVTGEEGETKCEYPYGYIRLTQGLDGDHFDCFLGPNLHATHAYVITQLKAPHFLEVDEQKAMLGFDSAREAVDAYLRHYTTPRFFWEVTAIPMEEFQRRVAETKTRPCLIKALTYAQETAVIHERAKTLDAQRPHRFQAAKWTHPNGHPRCRICGDEERVGGMCAGRATFQKGRVLLWFGKASCSPGDNCRWITVHSGGTGEGQPVLIRESKNSPGTYHVIGGAGGKLNYLKLTHVKSEAEYKRQAADRAKDKKAAAREQTKADKEAGVYQAKKQVLEGLRGQKEQYERQVIEQIADVAGWQDYDLTDEHLAGLSDAARRAAVLQHHRALLTDAMEVVRQTKEQLLLDADARAEANLGEMALHRTEPDVLGLTDLTEAKIPDTDPAPVKRYGEKAAAQGLTDDELAEQLGEVKQKRAQEVGEARAEAGKRLQEKMAEVREELKRHDEAGKLAVPGRSVKPVPAAKAMQVLTLAKQLKAVQQATRKKAEAIKTGTAPLGKAYVIEAKPVDSGQILEELEADAAERERQDRCKSFLQMVETPLTLEEADRGRTTLERHIQGGAGDALTRASIGLTGQDVLPHDVLDVLGTAGAAQALAYAMHANLSKEEVQAAAERLVAYHVGHHATAAQEAMDEARERAEQAKEIELGSVETPSELAIAHELNQRRLSLLQDARTVLGRTLGEMEATAALEYALQAQPVSQIQVSLGAISAEMAIKQARALGLEKSDFEIQGDGANQFLTVRDSGLPKLTKRIDPAEAQRYEQTRAIMAGERDEDNWLPDGFARRPMNTYTDPNEQAISFAQPFVLSDQGLIDQDLKDYIGSRIADGEPVAAVYQSLLSHDITSLIPEDKRDAYFQAVDRVAPLRDEQGEVVRAESHTDTFQTMAAEYVAKKYGPEAAPLHQQRIDPTSPKTFEALHRVLADEPARMVAFKRTGDLTPQDQAVLRRVFEQRFAKPEEDTATKDALEALGPEPEKESEGLFGIQENPEWRAWQTKRQEIMATAKQVGLTWDKYIDLHRGREHAYAALQDVLKGDAAQKFAEAYRKVAKVPLKIGRTVLRSNLAHLDAVDPQAREARLQAQRQLVDRLRNRVEGKYATGGVRDKLDRARELAEIADQNQVSMFMTNPEGPAELQKDERWTLGKAAEEQLAAILPQVARNFHPDRPVTLIPDLRMDGPRFAQQQRAIKLMEANKRMAMALGTGSGKTAIGLGTFTHLHSQGKITRGLFAVPSIVQQQFGAEAANLLEPGQYQWWANAGAPREERIAAYKDPQHHFAVVTHQALRDDLLHLLATHRGVSEDQMSEDFSAMTPAERQATLRRILETEGIKWDYLNVDEAHNALNRKGKPDSLFAAMVDALSAHTPYYMASSADPIKNDLSEVYDQLRKIDPVRYKDRDDFLAKYGLNTTSSRDALKRELIGRILPGRVDPGVKAIKQDVPVSLSDPQRTAYDVVMVAYRKAMLARREDTVDLAALKVLSPSSFGAGDDAATAQRLNDNLGILRDTALERVVNLGDPKDNAKMKAVVEKVNAFRQQGKPGIIFAHHREAVANLAKLLKEQGHKVITLTGSDSAKVKGQKIRMFRPPAGREPEADVMVLSDAGAVGANLQRGQWAIHYDLPHTAKTWWQRTGRIHRLGQKEDVDILTMQTDTVLDAKKRARLQRKEGLREMLTSPYENLEESGLAASLLVKPAEELAAA